MQWGSGIWLVGPGGQAWAIPSAPYMDLLVYLRLCGPTVIGPVTDQQWKFLRDVSATVDPSPQTTAVTATLALTEADAAAIAQQIAAPQVVLTDAQLAAVVQAAKSGAEDAVRGLSFVTTVK